MKPTIPALKLFLIVFISLFITSCKQQPETEDKSGSETKVVNVESLKAVFLKGWNDRDSAAIMNTIAENAIVMNDSLVLEGKDEISLKWVSGGVKVLSNIATTSATKGSNMNIAYDAGTYSSDLTIPGQPVLKEKGNYSLIWNKQNNGEWKLVHIHIEDVTRMPDIQ